jgi:hypothetical protein
MLLDLKPARDNVSSLAALLFCIAIAAGTPAALAEQPDAPLGEAADDSSAEGAPYPPRRHRLDFGSIWFDSEEGRQLTGFLQYSVTASDHHLFAATLPLIDSDVAGSAGSGIGDLALQYSYVPSAKLSASPWAPRSLGLGLGLIIPPGDFETGTASDWWIAIPSLGWVAQVSERFSLLPQLQYFQTLNRGASGFDLSSASLELGLLYVTPIEVWLNYTPKAFRDFKPEGDATLNHTLTVGKQFGRTFGTSLAFSSIERRDIQNTTIQEADDFATTLTLHFILPW